MSNLEATLKSYLDQWKQYFEHYSSNEDLLDRLRSFAFDGNLRSCKFRSVCWRIFLGCLPSEISGWKAAVDKSRQQYVEIKNLHVTKPSHESEGKDLEVENPLSQSDQSSWLKYFKNSELKRTIERDVKRTFPEMEYFHNEKVHELLVNVLFCYAREHKDLSYRQGMHELLAPLVFIIHCDLQAACHAREIGSLIDIIDTILDVDYLEHDSYNMFCHLMESTNAWYAITNRGLKEMREEMSTSERETSRSENGNTMSAKPFQPQEISTGNGPTLAITNKLNHIHNTLLVQHDLQLHTHLNSLEIIPQVFGLRWIRLLFGREFSLQDLLVLWDAVFADSHTLDLVDYLFVAMLIHIRHHLLNADYSTCMQILMKYPPVDDINDIVKAAKDIRQLKEQSFSDSLMEGFAQNPPQATQTARRRLPAPKMSNTSSKQNSLTKLLKDITRKVIPNNNPVSPPHSSLNDPTYAGHVKSPAQGQQQTGQKWTANGHHTAKQTRLFHEAPKPEEMLRKNPTLLEEDISAMQLEMDKLKQMCLYCSDKIATSVTILQSSVSMSSNDDDIHSDSVREDVEDATKNKEQKTFEKEQILLAVASLKQVRDLLQGSLTFNPNLREYTRTKDIPQIPEEHKNGVDSKEEVAEVPSSVSNTSALNYEGGDA